MESLDFFKTPFWIEDKPEFVKSLNKASDKYLKKIKKNEFGKSYPSTPLTLDNDFLDLRKYIGNKSKEFLDWQGFNLLNHKAIITGFWVQEFSHKGGGHQSVHGHPNQHVSGFYFLKCSKKTSYPVFHDPRVGARATRLPLKSKEEISYGSNTTTIIPEPGTLMIFPGYLEHEFAVDPGIQPFRFIHWNIQIIPRLSDD
tara:strand:+ start:63 stop:659 length:597 start_codon:yes stop_codon:yes gene_type:complete